MSSTEALDKRWLQLRTEWFDLRSSPGALSIDPQVTRLDDARLIPRAVSSTGVRRDNAVARALESGHAAGLAAFQNETHWYFLGTRRVGTAVEVFVEKRNGERLETLAAATLPAATQLELRISGNARGYRSRIERRTAAGGRLKENDDGSILGTDVAGGLRRSVVGPYAREEPAYRDLNLSFEARAADLVAHMTLEEKIAQLGQQRAAIPRLGVPQ